MVEMAEDPALLITKWTLQRWNLCPTSFLYIKDKTAQLKIGCYLTDFFVFLFCCFALCQSSHLKSCLQKSRECHSNLQSLIDLLPLLYMCLSSSEPSPSSLIFSTNSLPVMGFQETFIMLYVFSNRKKKKRVRKTLKGTSLSHRCFNECRLLVFLSCFLSQRGLLCCCLH